MASSKLVAVLASLLTMSIVGASCAARDVEDAVPVERSVNEAEDRVPITIPLTLYRLTDTDGSGLGTSRTSEEINEIGGRMAEIWAQADIVFEPLLVRDIAVPSALLEPIVRRGEIEPLVEAFGDTIDISDPGIINGFYLSTAFGVNGFAPNGTRIFFVVDEPTVPDERVSSHEVGHLFALHHNTTDPGRLMFSGTDGTVLTAQEQTVARYAAQGVLDGQR